MRFSVMRSERLYRGDIDDPKTMSPRRKVGIASEIARELWEWMELVGKKPTAWVFTSENPASPRGGQPHGGCGIEALGSHIR
jgi:hypothetical protein